MIKLLSFTFQNSILYKKKTVVPVGTPGLVYLRGLNKDGNVDRLSNGAGKTFLIQMLRGFIFGSSERGHFKRFLSKGFIGALKFEDTRKKLVWDFIYDLDNNHWSILKNGKEEHVSHKASDCQKFLQKQIGITSQEWDYFVSIDQDATKTLLRGTPSERKAYLESFFNIDVFYAEQKEKYDLKLADIDTRLSLLDQDRAKLEQVEMSLRKLPGDLWLETQLYFAQEAIIKLDKDGRALSKRIKPLEAKILDWNSYLEVFEELETEFGRKIPKASDLSLSLEVLYQKQSTIKGAIKAKADLQRLIKLELDPHKQKEPDSGYEPEVEEPDVEIITEKEKLLSKIQAKKELEDRVEALEDELVDFEQPTLSEKECNNKIDAFTKELGEQRFHLDLLDKSDAKGNCPTCGRTLELLEKHAKSPVELKKELKGKIARIKEEIAEAKTIIQTHQSQGLKVLRLKELQKELDLLCDFQVKEGVLVKEITELKRISDLWKKWRVVNKKYEQWSSTLTEIQARANALGFPSRLDENLEPDLAEVSEEIEGVQTELARIQRYEVLQEKVASYPKRIDLEDEVKAIQEELDQITKHISELNILKGEYKSKIEIVIELMKDEESLKKNLADYDDLLKQKRKTAVMCKFFDNRGFKLYELKRRCSFLIKKANFWSSMFFQEPLEWSMTDDLDNIDLLVRPINHKGIEPYPVSLLSGGETNRAGRVLLFSQLQLIPPNKNLNLLILDEIEGNLDEAGLTAFTEDVVPRLRLTFSDKTIILISHQAGLNTSEHVDHLWVAQRENRESTLQTYQFFNRRSVKNGS